MGGLTPRKRVEQNPGIISYVPQRVALISGTIRENVALGVPPDQIIEKSISYALEKASIVDFVHGLPEGLNTFVGENGYNLSGGQAQRIGLARALYTNPEILILDEATSALDSETENAISESLHQLAGNITLIVVAHRLATVRQANKILYLGEGNHYQLGTFEELRERIPKFDRQAKLLGL
jgi:ABC-type multidrug transport system fused ATPase/permease subunit